jgi:hypothetical protein
MNVWRRGPLHKNPYARTAFRVARVSREVVRPRTLAQYIGRTRQIVSRDASAHMLGGTPVTDAELNAAVAILHDATQRVLEELLEHATEKLPLERVNKLGRGVAKAMAVEDADGLRDKNLEAFQSWSKNLARQFLDSAHTPSPSFGAFETEPIPPFGR